MNSFTQSFITKLRNVLVVAAIGIFATNSVFSEVKYYTFEGFVTHYSGTLSTTYCPAVGDSVRYVFKVDLASEGSYTMDTGEVVVMEDADEGVPGDYCSDLWCDNSYHYFYADLIYGDYITYPTFNLTGIMEMNFGEDRHYENSAYWSLYSQLHGDSEDNLKLIRNHDSFTFIDEWEVGGAGFEGSEAYELGTIYFDLDLTAISDTSPLMTVDIDVDPKKTTNIIRMDGLRMLQVAIFSSESFDATEIVTDSIRLGRGGATVWEGTTSGAKVQVKDLDKDGYEDLLAGFSPNVLGLICGDTQITLTAETIDGTMITGTDSISITKCD